jgi:hypothetical protein
VNYIQYTINCGGLEVKRRYSEFASLRATLVNLHPTLIIPPIPEKHTMADYAAKPTKAKEDAGIIELRKRMLAVFLNRCRKMKDVLEDGVFWRFLDPYTSWVCSPETLSLTGKADICCVERRARQPSCIEHPQANPQSTSARYRESHPSPQLPSCPIVFSQTEIRRTDIKFGHARSPTWQCCYAFCSRSHNSRTADIWPLSTRLTRHVGRGAGPLLRSF